MTRQLKESKIEGRNLLLYDNTGEILGGLTIRTISPYVTQTMLYRYSAQILEFPGPPSPQWAIFHLNMDGSTATKLRRNGHSLVRPGAYIVLQSNSNPINVTATAELSIRRLYSSEPSSREVSADRNAHQRHFRDSVRERDDKCVITGDGLGNTTPVPYAGSDAAHIYPVSRVAEWRQQNLQQHITDTSPATAITQTGLYSAQNGLLLRSDIHHLWDNFLIAIDPDADYKVICFHGEDTVEKKRRLGGNRIKGATHNSPNPNDRISPRLLRWHLKMCLLKMMKGNSQIKDWEHDLEPDTIEGILSEPDGAERMEVELFTRLGPYLA
ncbi:HNH endonuclease-domain-containing protein [Aspergillus karnatakaensis]|uniref:HNH endonuclease signature motif containing protein n=1 Tax=Aspergillus karnatakaensis TaxID=1810916 RepID=UPI003CCD415E